MQPGHERHVGPVTKRMAQRQRAVRGQLGQKPVGDRPQSLVLLRLGRGGGGVDGLVALGLGGGRDSVGRRLVRPDLHLRLGFGRQLVLRPDIAALDAKRAVAGDADERAGAGDLVGLEHDRTRGERLDRGLELGHALVLLVGQLLGFGGRRLDVGDLLLEGGKRPLLHVGQRHG